MTKQEVYNNIRYNENLVNSYSNNLRRLKNNINNLNSQISQCNSQISQLNSRMRELRKQINELDQLKSKYQKLQNDFMNRQSKRVNKFNVNFSKQLNLKFILSYINGMCSLLSGNEYKNAYNGLTSAIDTISNKIRVIQQEDNEVKEI